MEPKPALKYMDRAEYHRIVREAIAAWCSATDHEGRQAAEGVLKAHLGYDARNIVSALDSPPGICVGCGCLFGWWLVRSQEGRCGACAVIATEQAMRARLIAELMRERAEALDPRQGIQGGTELEAT